MITVLTVEAALEHTCAIFRERADGGDITPAERDLLIDGAILLAMHVDDLAQEGRAGSAPGCRESRDQHGLGGTNGTRPRQPPELTHCRRRLLGFVAPDPAGEFGCQPGWAGP